MKKEDLELGNRAKNRVHGRTGILTARSIRLNGNVSYLIKPDKLDKDEKVFDGTWTDDIMIEKIGEGIVGAELMKTSIELGMTVEHFNGFQGIVTERMDYLNGCVYFNVMPKCKKSNEMPKEEFIACQYLTEIKEAKSVQVNKSTTGGPASNAPDIT